MHHFSLVWLPLCLRCLYFEDYVPTLNEYIETIGKCRCAVGFVLNKSLVMKGD